MQHTQTHYWAVESVLDRVHEELNLNFSIIIVLGLKLIQNWNKKE